MELISEPQIILNDMFKTSSGKQQFQQLIKKWYSEDPDHTRVRSNYVIHKYFFYKKNKLLLHPYNDVHYLMNVPLSTIEAVLSELDNDYEAKQQQLSKIIHFENDSIVVVTPLTYEAAKKYGGNTTWCVSAAQTMAMYSALCTGDRKVFMFCPKQGDEKHILYTHKNQAIEFTDKEDNPLTKDEYLKYLESYNINQTFCDFNERCLRKFYYIKPKCFYCSCVSNCDKRETDELKRNLISQEEIYAEEC